MVTNGLGERKYSFPEDPHNTEGSQPVTQPESSGKELADKGGTERDARVHSAVQDFLTTVQTSQRQGDIAAGEINMGPPNPYLPPSETLPRGQPSEAKDLHYVPGQEVGTVTTDAPGGEGVVISRTFLENMARHVLGMSPETMRNLSDADLASRLNTFLEGRG